MNSRRLEAFVAVARHRSFTEAALDLHLSQSAVSQQISALETELDAKLPAWQELGRRLARAFLRFAG